MRLCIRLRRNFTGCFRTYISSNLSPICVRRTFVGAFKMLVRTAVVGFLALCAVVATASEPLSQLNLDTLPAGQGFEIHTADHILRCSLVNPATGEVTVRAAQDGTQFSVERRVFLLGATQGPQSNSGGLSLVLMHEIRAGMRIEIGLETLDVSARRLTSPVKAIKLLPGNDAVALAD